MKSGVSGALVFLMLAMGAHAATQHGTSNPVSKAVELLSSLEAKIISEGESSKKLFEEFSEWCEDAAANLGYEIKTGKAEVADLKATIEKETALTSSLSSKIEELTGQIAAAEADLKAATEIRTKEAADFGAEEKELTEVVSMLERATAILEREMSKGGASFLQGQKLGNVVQALQAMVQAAMFDSADAQRLTAFVQSEQQTQADQEDSDSDLGAPDAAVYEGHSGSIIETLEGLTSKAEEQLAEARKTETNNIHNYEMLKQSLEDEIKFANKDMAEAKTNLAASQEATATAEGDLSVTTKDLAEDEASLKTANTDCMQKAQDYEAEVKSRAEELKALAAAKTALSEMTSGAQDLSYSFTHISLLQTDKSSSRSELVVHEVVHIIRDLARKEGSSMLQQLASRISSTIRLEAGNSADPFAKVTGLIKDMIAKLEGEASADASHKAYCDKELSESTAKKEDKMAEIKKLSTKIDQSSATSAKLKDEVATLQKELAELASNQAEMDKLRAEESAAFKTNKADMEQGIKGVKVALNVLREYYGSEKAHAAAEGAGEGIIGLLEVAESDFTKGLSEMVVEEQTAEATYEKTTKQNEIAKVTKEKGVEYKTKESAKLDKAVAELSSDRDGVQTELTAILDYLKTLQDQCVAKPETYSDRKAKREAEIAGLKEALSILDNETALLQRSRRSLRNVKHH